MNFKIGDKLIYDRKRLRQNNIKWIRKFGKPLLSELDICEMSKRIFTVISIEKYGCKVIINNNHSESMPIFKTDMGFIKL